MCFHVYKNSKVKVAKGDFYVMKRGAVNTVKKSIIDTVTNRFISEYEQYVYESNVTQPIVQLKTVSSADRSTESIENIHEGYHSYREFYKPFKGLKCAGIFKIPKGVKYYYNPDDGGYSEIQDRRYTGEYVSERIIYIRPY